jgi:hypothetical protein
MSQPPEMDSVFVGTVAYRAIRRFTLGADNDVQSFSRMLFGFTTDKLWQTGWIDESSGRFHKAESLQDFVEKHLEVSIAWVHAKLALAAPLDDSKDRLVAAAQAAFTQAITEETGRSPKDWYESVAAKSAEPIGAVGRPVDNASNRNISVKGGTSADYTRKRLKRDRPDLLERVAEGEMSLNAAAIEAGFRKVKTPLDAAKTAVAKLSPADRAELVAWMTVAKWQHDANLESAPAV